MLNLYPVAGELVVRSLRGACRSFVKRLASRETCAALGFACG